MTPTQIARDALAGQMTPLDALVRIAEMEDVPMTTRQTTNGTWTSGGWTNLIEIEGHIDSTPAITDEVVERCRNAYGRTPGTCADGIRGALEEFVRQTRPLTHPEEIRRATEQAAREAAMAAVEERDAHTTVYAQTADDEAGRVAWATGEPLNDAWPAAKIDGWWDAHRRWGKQEGGR